MTADPNDAAAYDDCGFDISHNNTGLNFDVLANAGRRKCCILKVTEGSTFKDPAFAASLAALLQTSIQRFGVYHFAHHQSPADQVNFFIDTFKTATQAITNKPNFLFMLDLERSGNPPTEADALPMVQQLQARGISPIIYCGGDFWSQNHPELATCPHLLAAYNNH